MKVLLAGATGFIGKALFPFLRGHGYSIAVLGRDAEQLAKCFPDAMAHYTWADINVEHVNQYDAVLNLAGANIGAKRWSKAYREEIISSRVASTSQLAALILDCANPPRLLNASAIGIYGLQETETSLPQALTEESLVNTEAPKDFLSTVGLAWEQAASALLDANLPVTYLRFGVVLGKEGVLQKLLPSFRFGMGAIIGSGQQAFTWVALADVLSAILFLLEHSDLTGGFNITAPFCVTQKKFAKTLAKVLKRPCWLSMPAWFLQLLLGEMAEELLLKGQHVSPARLMAAGFSFQYPEIESALIKALDH